MFVSGEKSKSSGKDKHCILMDEVDGMAGNEDRGGINVRRGVGGMAGNEDRGGINVRREVGGSPLDRVDCLHDGCPNNRNLKVEVESDKIASLMVNLEPYGRRTFGLHGRSCLQKACQQAMAVDVKGNAAQQRVVPICLVSNTDIEATANQRWTPDGPLATPQLFRVAIGSQWRLGLCSSSFRISLINLDSSNVACWSC